MGSHKLLEAFSFLRFELYKKHHEKLQLTNFAFFSHASASDPNVNTHEKGTRTHAGSKSLHGVEIIRKH